MKFKKALKSSWHYIRRSPYYSLSAILVMSLTVFVTGLFAVAVIGSGRLLNYFERRPQVVAFLTEETTRVQADEISFRLMATGKVEKVTYVSKEEALTIYQDLIKDDPLLLEMVTADILPASLEISANQITDLNEIAVMLQDEPGVEEVGFQQDVVEALEKLIISIRRVGLAVVIFLVIVSILVTLVVVGMKASARRKEIKVMQLVGATAGFVRSPFLLEGTIYGLVSGLVGWLGVLILVLATKPVLDSLVPGLTIFSLTWLGGLGLLMGMIGFGIGLGSLGSLLAIRRYLRS